MESKKIKNKDLLFLFSFLESVNKKNQKEIAELSVLSDVSKEAAKARSERKSVCLAISKEIPLILTAIEEAGDAYNLELDCIRVDTAMVDEKGVLMLSEDKSDYLYDKEGRKEFLVKTSLLSNKYIDLDVKIIFKKAPAFSKEYNEVVEKITK